MYKKTNLAAGTLSAQLLVGGSSLVLQTDEGLKFPDTGSGNTFVGVIWGAAYSSPEKDATTEFVVAYRSSGDTFSITRAQEGTSAKQWEIGDNFMLTASKAVFDEYETALGDKADKTNVLELDNTDAFTPDADYEPATKKYVDDNIPAIPVKATKAESAAGTDDAKFLTSLAAAELWKLPEGSLYNGKIVPSVASNNITLALKGKDGNDPSATNPVYVIINGTLRTITEALSKTVNAGANSFNSGSSELATKEIDYFVYLGYNATDGVVIGFSRIPYACSYDDFSTTATNEKYCAISTITNAVATDYYHVIGRFAATLSAGTGYTWSIPTFTAKNLIQRPIYKTRWLNWQPVYSATGSMTFTSVTTELSKYIIDMDRLEFTIRSYGTTGGTASTGITASLPFAMGLYSTAPQWFSSAVYDNNGFSGTAEAVSATLLIWNKYDHSNWGLSTSKYILGEISYKI